MHTSPEHPGQIYLPAVNQALMVACVAVVLAFRSSGALAAAYGLAVAGTMGITTVLFAFVARERWHWPPWALGLGVGLFLTLDVAFLGANLLKLPEGGWLPLAMGSGVFLLMDVWRRGRTLLIEHATPRGLPMDTLVESLTAAGHLPRVPGTAVFLSGTRHGTPLVLRHHLRHNKLLHEHVVVMTVITEPVPSIPEAQRVEHEALGPGISRVQARYGFMEHPDVPRALAQAREQGLRYPAEEATFYVGRVTLRPKRGGEAPRWLQRLFGLMQRNAHPTTDYFRLPAHQVMELGAKVEL